MTEKDTFFQLDPKDFQNSKVLDGMNKELKELFDKHKIESPYPQIVIHTKNSSTK